MNSKEVGEGHADCVDSVMFLLTSHYSLFMPYVLPLMVEQFHE